MTVDHDHQPGWIGEALAEHEQAQHEQAQHEQAQHEQAQHEQAQHEQAQHEQAEHDQLEAHGRRQLPLADREQQVLDRIDRARRRRPKVREERITMSHGPAARRPTP